MSLPPGFLDELRSRISLSSVVGRKVVWDRRKSNPAKGDLWAPCPFHQEKTASFHVDDRKGFYYCFGCHAKGDALTFLREAENLSFMEAVETLAREAGMTMPAADPRAAERADRRTELAGVMEEAVRHYRMQAKTAAGSDARDYLARRKLSEAAQDRFDIGFAPDQRQGLFQALTGKGIAADLLVEAGLCARPESGGAPFDRFRGRIIFPIRDARGRCIALGGRALDPAAPAKYLNSPETPLFDKGKTLYNHGPARDAAGRGQQLIVAEGYMDVIALVTAGFEAAVAPLGTAITEDQLRLIWRLHPEPVIMLDGDQAGLRAAARLVDLALPQLEAGFGLRFVVLPEKLDPDDFLKLRGPEAMTGLIEAAEPMVNLLWQRETEGRVFDSPERRAGLDKVLRETIRRIADPSIRAHYGDEIARLRAELFGTAGPGGRGGRRAAAGERRPGTWQPGAWQPGEWRGGMRAAGQPLPETRASLLVVAEGAEIEDYLREAMILAIGAIHPSCVIRLESQFERVELRHPDHDRLRHALIAAAHEAGTDGYAGKIAERAGAELEKIMSIAHVRSAPPVLNGKDGEFALQCLAEEFAKLEARRGAEAEIAEAMEDLTGLADEGVTWRLSQAAKARHRAERSKLDDDGDMGEDRAALSAQLQELIDKAAWEKKR